jgi:site-specific DNA-cytosine methylase
MNEQYRQIGNAVPVELGNAFSKPVSNNLKLFIQKNNRIWLTC